MKTPEFWRKRNLLSTALLPLGELYRIGGLCRQTLAGSPYRASIPVICVGNVVAGGAGKTPVALSIAQKLLAQGASVHFLTRGYGGRETGPVLVDSGRHGFEDVGDEALLLSRIAPTWVSRNRAAGCQAAEAEGASVIIMDDGFQNPTLAKDLSLLVVDSGYGFGNGRMIPAGPLREPVDQAEARADAMIVVGAEGVGVVTQRPLIRAHIKPGPELDCFKGKPVIAFAGIGRPEKFFETVRGIGCTVLASYGFADHHSYTEQEMKSLVAEAENLGAALVTTEKDAVRLPVAFRNRVTVLTIGLEWGNEEAISELLSGVI